MALIELSEVSSVLRCPRCRQPLTTSTTGYRCGTAGCLYSERCFPALGGSPVLVDFEHSIVERDRLLDPARGTAVVPGSRWRAERVPGWLRTAVVKPRNRVAERNIARLLALLDEPSPLVLVIGGATEGNGVEAIYREPRVRVLGFDIYVSPLTQFIADAHQIPVADVSVDAVVVQAVLEHVLDPAQVVEEIHRVLKPGGLVYAETPFLQQVHAGPNDFNRYTSSGHRYLFRAFEEIAAGPVAGPGTQLLWSLDHLVRGVMRSELAGKLARVGFFWLRYLDRLTPTSYAMDSASAYYFLGRVSDMELGPHEILHYYRGAQRRDPLV